jgi:glycerol kinase
MHGYLLAIDQGTTGSTALVMGLDGKTLGRETCELPQHFPKPAWVEHDPDEICASVERAVSGALRQAGVRGNDINAIGITNQRETTLLWERTSGRPIQRAIVWQDRRTTPECEALKAAGHEDLVRERTGLVIDPYFSATKIAWLLDHTSGARTRAEAGELAFGTVDSYLIWWLAGGADAAAPHVIEATNASRTSLMNLAQIAWDPELCELFRVPRSILPKIVPSAGPITRTRGSSFLPDGVPICGVAGDQQAALFGQACFSPGEGKCTYGTGAFVVVNTGAERVQSRHGLITTLAWQLPGGLGSGGADGSALTASYALEGSCFVAGAAVQWLRDGLGVIRSSKEVEALARSVPSSDGVVFVPALSGLGAPHWDPEARGLITGLTRGSTAGHLARATLEAIALQVNDVIEAIRDDLPRPVSTLRVDGGAAENDLLMQYQADVSDLVIQRPDNLETTARGAAMLAGVGAGLFPDIRQAAQMVQHPESFQPTLSAAARTEHLERWRVALERTRSRKH